MREIEEGFAGLPMLKAGFRKGEVVGIEALRSLGEDIFSDIEPTAVLVDEKPVNIGQDDGRYVLSMRLPFVSKDGLGVWVRGDELVVRISNFKRNLILPHALASRDLIEARMDGDLLEVYFGGESDGEN